MGKKRGTQEAAMTDQPAIYIRLLSHRARTWVLRTLQDPNRSSYWLLGFTVTRPRSFGIYRVTAEEIAHLRSQPYPYGRHAFVVVAARDHADIGMCT